MRPSICFTIGYGIYVAFMFGLACGDVGEVQPPWTFGVEHIFILLGIFIVPFLLGMVVEHLRINGD